MLTELSEAQKQLVAIKRNEWLKHGLSCEPTNLGECLPFVEMMYQNAGLEAPTLTVLTDSPRHAAKVAASLKAIEKTTAGNREHWLGYLQILKDRPDDWEYLLMDVKPGEFEPEVTNDMWYLSHNAGWVGFYDTFAALGVLPTKHLLFPIVELAKRAGWCSTYSDVCILQRRHTEVHLVDGELHREDGPAVMYADGWCVWAITGVNVNEKIVLRPETQTLAEIQAEDNEERKRIRIERYSWQRYLTEIGAKVIHRRRNDIEATQEALMSAGDMRVLVGACPSTARVYGLEVPANIETCEAAQSWLRNSGEGFCVGAS